MTPLLPLTFAAVLLPPLVTVPVAVAVVAGLWWYWLGLGRRAVPPSRRRIRRLSLIVMLVSLPVFVQGLSFADPQVDPQHFIRVWTLAIVLMFIVIACGAFDAINSVRLHQQAVREDMAEAAKQLGAALRRRDADAGGELHRRDAEAHAANRGRRAGRGRGQR